MDVFPLTETGELKRDRHHGWMKTQELIETSDEGKKSSLEVVSIPTQSDIWFRLQQLVPRRKLCTLASCTKEAETDSKLIGIHFPLFQRRNPSVEACKKVHKAGRKDILVNL